MPTYIFLFLFGVAIGGIITRVAALVMARRLNRRNAELLVEMKAAVDQPIWSLGFPIITTDHCPPTKVYGINPDYLLHDNKPINIDTLFMNPNVKARLSNLKDAD